MAAKRGRIDIINDMLLAIQKKGGRIKPTHLMYKANLSHASLKTYLDDLVRSDLVKKVTKEKYPYILSTDKGHTFVQKFNEMKEFERSFGL